MIVWGSGGDIVEVQSEGKQECPNCECKRRFSLLLRYEYTHVYFIFAFVTSRQYFVTCDVCNQGYKVKRKDVEAELERIPIPFMRRFGCLVGLGTILCFFILSFGSVLLSEVVKKH